MNKNDFILTLFKEKQTVFSFNEIALLFNEEKFLRLKQKLNYYTKIGIIKSVRRGIYVKENYNKEELACKIFKPSYLSTEYVLQKNANIFQYNEQITSITYLSRAIEISSYKLIYRKIKNNILLNTTGINRINGINIATPERAFLDTLYLNKNYYFDNINNLNIDFINKLLPIYDLKQLNLRVNKLLANA